MAKKILLLDPVHPVLEDALSEMGIALEKDYTSPKEALLPRLSAFNGVIIRSRLSVDRAFFMAATNLEFIAREGVGLDHIDTAFAEKRGIQVFNSPEGSRDAVGEHTLGMLLDLFNRISRSDRQIREGQWLREPNRGLQLKGKTIGILGYGNMGSTFAKKLAGLEVEVIAYDKYKTDFSTVYAKEVDLPTFFAETDVLSIHIPYDADNHYFIDKAFLDHFAKPLFVLNTARGGVLNTKDLVTALASGKVVGAGLDVLEYEEISFTQFSFDELPAPFQYLRQSDRVVLTPHIAGWSDTTKELHGRVLAEKIKTFWG